MNALRLGMTGLAVLLLAAHFLRAGRTGGTVATLALLALLAIPRVWALRALQGALALGAALWVRTAFGLAAERRALGGETARLWVILGGAALFTAFAAWLLEGRIRSLRPRRSV